MTIAFSAKTASRKRKSLRARSGGFEPPTPFFCLAEKYYYALINIGYLREYIELSRSFLLDGILAEDADAARAHVWTFDMLNPFTLSSE
jgi:hypothetical protein